MKKSDLNFSFPEELIATSPSRPSRVLYKARNDTFSEINISELLNRIPSDAILVRNNTLVEPRRVVGKTSSGAEFEILFIEKVTAQRWKVLFPSRRLKKNESILLPEGREAQLVATGRPQEIELNQEVTSEYFFKNGEMPIPPYIQKAREHSGEKRSSTEEDKKWYQTDWAEVAGSSAAPTASLHFSNDDFLKLQARGVTIVDITLHVGLGTFLPLEHEDLENHVMHEEYVEISASAVRVLKRAVQSEQPIWALGTTSMRAVESLACGILKLNPEGGCSGFTNLFIHSPESIKWVNALMTNFHQPETTLLALVMSFAGQKEVLEGYKFAIERRFRLFSYGDLSVWIR